MGNLSFKVGEVTISASSEFVAGLVLARAFQHTEPSLVAQPAGATFPPALGTTWAGQGGIYAGVIRGDDGLTYYLIASTQELHGEWGNYGNEIEGADSRNDGLSNTQAMAAAGSQLALDALAVTADGHNDFYLPAQCELNLCFANAREGFKPEWHWSSTQFSAYYSWSQYFEDGYQGNGNKSSARPARAVRRFLVNSVI